MIIHIAFWIMTACAICLAVMNQRLYKELCKTRQQLKHLADLNLEEIASRTREARVDELTTPIPRFVVYQQGYNKRFVIEAYTYNPADPFDRDYKRIHAREVADKLNEKP